MSFDGKVVMVTGGSRGIGKEIALEFARRGADIVFNYLRNHEHAVDTQREIEALGVQCLKIKAHLGDPEKIKQLFVEVAEAYTTLDVLINNAASGVQRSAQELEQKHWDWTMNINARAPWLCSIEAARLMKDGGSIVNMTSLGSQKVLPHYFSVGTSKATLETITRYLAVELAPKKINVNAVSGGYVDTDALATFPQGDEMRRIGAQTLIKRMLTGLDIANVVAFLCSDSATMIRGQVLVVDGGATLMG